MPRSPLVVASALLVGVACACACSGSGAAPERSSSHVRDDAALGAAAQVPTPGPAANPKPEPDAALVLPPVALPPSSLQGPAIVDAPMKWSGERERLTLEYRRAHSDPTATDLTIAPTVIVLHYTGGGSAKATRGYFDTVRIEASRTQLARAGAVNVSSHFLIDRDGTIYQLQPATRFARHCIGLNHVAIGIENVGDEAKWPLTDAQVTADAALVRALVARYPITRLLGHQEVMGFRDHAEYVELDPTYRNDKPDPGRRFLSRVRALVEDLHLGGAD